METISWIYPGGLNRVTRVLIKERQEGQSQRRRYGGDTVLALKMEEGDTSQGRQATYRSWKRQGNSPLEPKVEHSLGTS